MHMLYQLFVKLSHFLVSFLNSPFLRRFFISTNPTLFDTSKTTNIGLLHGFIDKNKHIGKGIYH